MNYFNYNGKVLADGELIIAPDNRGLRYGDGIFETIKLKNGKLILSDEHFVRLWKGLETLQFEIPKHFSQKKLEEEIIQLAKKNKLTNARIRLTIIRGNGGMYDPKNHIPNYIIEAIKLPEDNGPLNTNGLQICIYNNGVKSIDAFSNLKTNNYLPYFMGAIFAKKNQCNDAVILNSNGNICDSTISNIFLIKNETLHTPALTEGCVAGVMRQWIINNVGEFNLKVIEKSITKDDLLNADEVFLTNSIYNIRWVAGLENKKYENKQTAKLTEILMRKRGNVYC
ncbi:MAG: aminotransferase class IV [Ferruginibacter sp.]